MSAPLRRIVIDNDIDVVRTVNPFMAFLCEQGVMPFTEKSVERYKAEAIRQRGPKFYKRRDFWDKVAVGFGIAGLMCFVVTVGSAIIANWFPQVAIYVTGPAGIAVFVCTGLMLGFSYLWSEMKSPPEFSWKRWNYDFYRLHVPDGVRNLASEIKKRFSYAELYIDELSQDQLPVDPFLIVHFDNQDYYITVWDETGFNGERTA